VSAAGGAAGGSTPLAGIGLAVAASVSFALLDALVKWLAQTYPSPLVAWWRYVLHVALMAAVLAPSRGRTLLRTRRPGLQVARGACLGLSSLTFFAALSRMPLAEATAIIAISPILVSAIAVALLGERAPRGTWLALLVSFAGVLLIVRPGSELFDTAALLPLLAACFAAGYVLCTRQLAGTDDALATLFIGAVVATLLLSGLAPLYWTPVRSVGDALLFVLAGAIGAGGHGLLVRAYARAGAAALAPYTYAHTVAAVGTGWLVFGMLPDGLAALGIVLVVATGVTMAIRSR
jgi:drug/metabolite transporter (DMT)-like permease